MEKQLKDARILFLFPKSVKKELLLIEKQEAPSERLYGMYELFKSGYKVDYCDAFYEGRFAKVYAFIKRFRIKWLPLTVLFKVLRADIVFIKDDFYTLVALVARLAGKKVIYEDSIFAPPKKPIRKAHAWVNLALAHKVIAFSQSQIDIWRADFPAYAHKFAHLYYPVDREFYLRGCSSSPEKSTLISIGRDLGRDNHTLYAAIKKMGHRLDLVTLPYLVSAAMHDDSKVFIHKYISYFDLFSIYGRSICSVVPLKSGITYPSGIRAVMEAMVLSVPVIAARTPVLMEYFKDKKDILYYDPENVDDLIEKIAYIEAGSFEREKVICHASKTMEKYAIEPYVDQLLVLMTDVLNNS